MLSTGFCGTNPFGVKILSTNQLTHPVNPISSPIVPRSVPTLLSPWSTSVPAFLIIASSPSRPHRSAALIRICWAGVCGCGFVLLGFGLLEVTSESPCARPLDAYKGGTEGAAAFVIAPGVCTDGCCSCVYEVASGGTPGGAFGCVADEF